MPVVPRDRWFICWVRGAITPEGWMDKLGSIVAAGVITAPWSKKRDRQDLDTVTPDKPSEKTLVEKKKRVTKTSIFTSSHKEQEAR